MLSRSGMALFGLMALVMGLLLLPLQTLIHLSATPFSELPTLVAGLLFCLNSPIAKRLH
ncbi:hypothetical protein K402DRAFT_397618 [Aulographum hederae CBS 113979]|uniref:Uncharacterized protein n=1 Tax=Aulographum hederae CBS 113979 TaxID=1176131 RepID=A0A6G1GN47_9PEZI|nr:hypothetical protein K402DRAFT_397618 [Aulographum hederae CBS 113979]